MIPVLTHWFWNLRQLWGMELLLSHAAMTEAHIKEGRAKRWTDTKSSYYHLNQIQPCLRRAQPWTSRQLHSFLFFKSYIDFFKSKPLLCIRLSVTCNRTSPNWYRGSGKLGVGCVDYWLLYLTRHDGLHNVIKWNVTGTMYRGAIKMWQTTGLVVFPLRTNAKVFCILYKRRRPGTPRRATRERHGVARNGSRERPGYCWGFRGEGKAGRVRQVIAVQRSPRDGRCHSCLSHFLPSLWPTLSPWRIYSLWAKTTIH